MTSIYEVAALANVSITTVSHVFSGKRYVSADTIARVHEAAAKLRYSPRATARGLATGRSMILGVSFPDNGGNSGLPENPYFFEFLEGVSSAASRNGCAISLVPRGHGGADHESARASLIDRIDGIVVVDPLDSDDLVDELSARSVHIVMVGRSARYPALRTIDSQIAEGIDQIFEHFIAQGYRRPALLLSHQFGSSFESDLEMAFGKQLAARGLSGSVFRESGTSGELPVRFAMDILTAAKRPDLIVASTDYAAAAVIHAASEAGLRIPEDLGIIGAGDTILAKATKPRLSSLRVFSKGLAEAAVSILLTLIEGRNSSSTERVKVQLIARESSSRTALP